jgi:hypothetical protein
VRQARRADSTEVLQPYCRQSAAATRGISDQHLGQLSIGGHRHDLQLLSRPRYQRRAPDPDRVTLNAGWQSPWVVGENRTSWKKQEVTHHKNRKDCYFLVHLVVIISLFFRVHIKTVTLPITQ